MTMTETQPPREAGESGLASGPFSAEVLPGDASWPSQTLVRIPRRLGAGARLALLLFLVFLALVVFIPWTQTISIHGRLTSYYPGERTQQIHSQINGRVLAWHANEGVEVTRGQVVIELSDINPKFMAPDLIEQLDQSRSALEEQRKATLEQAELLENRIEEMTALTEATLAKADAKILEAENKIQKTEQRIPVAQGALETARLNLERSQKLEAQGLLSRRELELAIQKMTETEAEVKTAQATLNETQSSRQALIHDKKKIAAELTQTLLDTRTKRASALSKAAKISKELADLKLKRSNALQRNQARKVVAPFEGTLVRLSPLGPGETVKEGALLFTMVPKRPSPAVEMWVDSIDAPLLRPGVPVRLFFQGMPAIPLPAWPELMSGTHAGRILVVDQAADAKGQFRLWVVPDRKGRPWPPQKQVRPGTNVRGWAILNRVPLWYEIWRRFNLFPPDYNIQQKSLLDTLIPKAGRPKK